jgi:hypothetical protein
VADLALRVLRAGVPGEHPAIDQDTLDLWLSSLKAYGPLAVRRTAEEWVEAEARFPSLQAFLGRVQETSRVLAIEQQAHEQPAGWIGRGDLELAACAECGGTNWVEAPDEARPGLFLIRPCSRCRPDQHELWKGGHLDPGHDRKNCPLEVCRTGKRKRG